jgi:phage terminase large subunit
VINLGSHANLIGWQLYAGEVEIVKPWKPEALGFEQWPPNYAAVYAWRIKTLALLRSDPVALASAKRYYASRPHEFIMHWMDTYNPRKSGSKWIPFVFFSKQSHFISFLHDCRLSHQSGLVEKARDVGATWLSCGYSVWSWLFIKDDAIGWGSRKQELVDKIGDVSSIFEKMRSIVRRLPDVFLPEGLKARDHLTFMKMINPENGSTIVGETGDNIGRGGRTAMYFKDESAHYERPEKIEAALGDNTNVQIDISSVNGLGNVFHRRREAGVDWSPNKQIEPGFVRVFIMDWSDHPEKTQAWYDERRAKYEREGMLHLFAQEIDRNYSAAISNTLIPYEWILAAVDAHKTIPYVAEYIVKNGIPNVWGAGLDVADEGIDRNSLSLRQWIIWRRCEEWGERDPGVTTRRAIAGCREHKGIRIQYDCIGVGTNVRSEYNRLVLDEKIISAEDCELVPWNAGDSVLNPYERIIPDDDGSILNNDMFQNLKAQAWWSLRTRFYKTFMAVKSGVIYPVDDLISLDSSMPLLHQLMKELAQPTRGFGASLKTIVNKKPDGMKSPDLADGGVMMFYPIPDNYGKTYVGSYG